MSVKKTDWYKVKKIIWNVDKDGKLRPILALTKPFELGDRCFDGLLTDTDTVKRFGISKGSVLKVELKGATIYDIKQVMKVIDRDPIPSNCPTCGSVLDEVHCTNYVCPSKGLTPIVKMLDIVCGHSRSPREIEAIINDYCSNFPVNASETNRVTDFLDYLTLLDPSRNLNTAARADILKSKFPNYHELLHKLENQVANWFTITIEKGAPLPHPTLTMPSHMFWDVLTLSGLKSTDYTILSDISPVGSYDLLSMCAHRGMSKSGQRVVSSIAPLVSRILDRARVNVI